MIIRANGKYLVVRAEISNVGKVSLDSIVQLTVDIESRCVVGCVGPGNVGPLIQRNCRVAEAILSAAMVVAYPPVNLSILNIHYPSDRVIIPDDILEDGV